MHTLAVILSRAGSKGLQNKAVLPLCGKPVIGYTFSHARHSESLDATCISTDSSRVAQLARAAGIEVIDRPLELATDTAAVDEAVRHALTEYESRHEFHADAIVLLYGNVPVRAPGIVDRAVEHLIRTGADSVRTVAPVGKHHPDWMHRLEHDVMHQYRPNHLHRRQDLDPLYYHDGAVVAVTRQALFAKPEDPDNHLAFFGRDCRAIVQGPNDTVDVDTLADFCYAEAILRLNNKEPLLGDTFGPGEYLLGAAGLGPRPVLTGAVAAGRCGRR